MAGMHQVNNMATAVAAVAALVPGALDSPERLSQGLKSVRVIGRLHPSADCPRVWLDVGHNPHAAQAVAAALRDLRLRPAACVLGMLRDKDAAAVAAALNPCMQSWYCAGIGGDRGRSGAELAREIMQVSGAKPILHFPGVAPALNAALEDSAPDETILVFGSFVTVAQAMAFLAGRT